MGEIYKEIRNAKQKYRKEEIQKEKRNTKQRGIGKLINTCQLTITEGR